jgi:hypothetical protein
MNWRIAKLGCDKTVSFAADELRKYIKQMDPGAEVSIAEIDRYREEFSNMLWVGIDPAISGKLPEVECRELDDAIFIDVVNGKGVISGTNPRSVLIAVYRFLSESGCTWVRPGRDGEIIPCKDPACTNVKVCEKASYRHRAVCIEGAVSFEHILDTIDWLPKVGMNGYFNQFMVPYTFFDRWYSHQNNPFLIPEPVTVEEVKGMVIQHVYEIKKRDMLYHSAGHGWTCEPFGIEGNSWDVKDYFVPEDVKPLLALVNEKRELWEGIPLNTNLCYSNTRVRDTITSAIADYCEMNPEIQYLHFWLADGSNNHCECVNCKETIPADYYVTMLNELDEKLSRKCIDTKVVFLIYVDLLWEAQKEKIKNPDRFVLMFAPITRTYTLTFGNIDPKVKVELKPYDRNRLTMPKSVEENLARLKKWQKQFKGDSFDFDYHLMWDHYLDPGYYRVAEVLWQDMKNLRKIGLNGMVSCQAQRVYFPTGLGMYVMAHTLWNEDIDFDNVAGMYFNAAYGEDGMIVKDYLKKLSELFDPPYLRMEREIVNDGYASRYASIPEVIEGFRPVVEHNITSVACPGIKRSWEILKYHGEVCIGLSKILAAKANGDMDTALKLWEDVKIYIQKNELVLNSVLDVFEFVWVLERAISRLN